MICKRRKAKIQIEGNKPDCPLFKRPRDLKKLKFYPPLLMGSPPSYKKRGKKVTLKM